MVKIHLVNNEPEPAQPPSHNEIPAPLGPNSLAQESKTTAAVMSKVDGFPEVTLQMGKRYRWFQKPGADYTYVGTLDFHGADVLRGFMRESNRDISGEHVFGPNADSIGNAVSQYVSRGEADNIPAGFAPADWLLVFRQDDRIMITNGTRGWQPIDEVDELGVRTRFFEMMQAPFANRRAFPQPVSAQEIAERSKSLDLKSGMKIIVVEPVDPYFPITLTLASLDVCAVSPKFKPEGDVELNGADKNLADTIERPQMMLLASDMTNEIARSGGTIKAVEGLDKADPSFPFEAAVIEGLPQPGDLPKLLAMMSDGSRILVGCLTPKLRAEVAESLESQTPQDVSLERIAEPANHIAYRITRKNNKGAATPTPMDSID
jgi:hypothetical protein